MGGAPSAGEGWEGLVLSSFYGCSLLRTASGSTFTCHTGSQPARLHVCPQMDEMLPLLDYSPEPNCLVAGAWAGAAVG